MNQAMRNNGFMNDALRTSSRKFEHHSGAGCTILIIDTMHKNGATHEDNGSKGADAVRRLVACCLFFFSSPQARETHTRQERGRFRTATGGKTTAAHCNVLFRRHKASGMSSNFVPVLFQKSSRGYQLRVEPKVMLPTKARGPAYDSALPLSQLIPLFGETDAAS